MVCRVETALLGRVPISTLSAEEFAAFNKELDRRIASRLAEIDWPRVLSARGHPTVAMDEEGHLVERSPDGSISPGCAGSDGEATG